MKAKKPSAADRTVDMWAAPKAPVLEDASKEDSEDAHRAAEPSIEANADRWLEKAIETQQYLSKKFADNEPNSDKFRLTEHGDMMSLEKFGLGPDGKAFSWWLVQFGSKNLYELASVVVAAAKARKAKENG